MHRIFIITFLLIILVSSSTYAINKPFYNTNEDTYGEYSWTKKYVEGITKEGIFDFFDSIIPKRLIKRGEFVKWLVKLKGYKLVNSGYEFSDVPKNNPNHDYIITAGIK